MSCLEQRRSLERYWPKRKRKRSRFSLWEFLTFFQTAATFLSSLRYRFFPVKRPVHPDVDETSVSHQICDHCGFFTNYDFILILIVPIKYYRVFLPSFHIYIHLPSPSGKPCFSVGGLKTKSYLSASVTQQN